MSGTPDYRSNPVDFLKWYLEQAGHVIDRPTQARLDWWRAYCEEKTGRGAASSALDPAQAGD